MRPRQSQSTRSGSTSAAAPPGRKPCRWSRRWRPARRRRTSEKVAFSHHRPLLIMWPTRCSASGSVSSQKSCASCARSSASTVARIRGSKNLRYNRRLATLIIACRCRSLSASGAPAYGATPGDVRVAPRRSPRSRRSSPPTTRRSRRRRTPGQQRRRPESTRSTTTGLRLPG